MGSVSAYSAAPAGARSQVRERARQDFEVMQQALNVLDDEGDEFDTALDEMTACMPAGAVAPAELSTPATDMATSEEFQALLAKLKTEPSDPQEVADKFGLYEEFLETVVSMRKKTYSLWEECKAEFADAPAVQADVERQLRAVDSTANMSLGTDASVWFVHGMTLQASRNSDSLGKVLGGMQGKLELLGKQEECPICLEALPTSTPEADPQGGEGGGFTAGHDDDVAAADAVPAARPEPTHVFGCCHSVCGPCWTHWSSIKGPSAPCPLCRHEDFLADIVQGRALPHAEFLEISGEA